MLPKKRKFTAADYDSFIVEPPSQPGDEATSSEEPITSITNSNDEPSSGQDVGGDSLMSEDGATSSNNNNGCDKVDASQYHPCNNEVQAKETNISLNEQLGNDNDEETVGIDLSKRRHESSERNSPVQSPPQPYSKYVSSSSGQPPFDPANRSPRRNSSSNFEKYKSSSLGDRNLEDVEEAIQNRQHVTPIPQQRHRYMSSPMSSVQYSARTNSSGIRISTPIGGHSLTRPRSAASDIAHGAFYGRSDQMLESEHHSEATSQHYQSQPGLKGVGPSSLPHSHPNNPVSVIPRQRLEGNFEIDLSDWIGHRILARRPSRDGSCNYYWPGMIHATFEDNRVSVSLDGEDNPLTYENVLSMAAKCAIVSDVVPSTNQVIALKVFRNIFIVLNLFHLPPTLTDNFISFRNLTG